MSLVRRNFLKLSTGAAAVVVASPAILRTGYAQAPQVTLKLQQQLPAAAPVPKNFLTPWAQKVEKESNGRIKIELYPSMQLGGTPSQVYDQVKDGVIDLTWTLPGYTPNRFPKSEVFELPFIAGDGEQNSAATWEFYEKHLKDEFKDVKMIAVQTNGPYLIHAKGNGVRKLEDMKGLKLRGTSRMINKMIETLGATPVGMPVPSVPDSLAKGVIDGTLLPWEVTTPLKISELVNTHTRFSGNRSLCVALFVTVMNKAKYESLPADLKAVIDANSGVETSKWAGKVQNDGDAPGLEAAQKRGNAIVTLDPAETRRWRAQAEPVVELWANEMKGKGIDGKALVEDARAMVARYAGPAT
jgi:TRAP-type C4-dicarboxylate transport system substrate-binding protein